MFLEHLLFWHIHKQKPSVKIYADLCCLRSHSCEHVPPPTTHRMLVLQGGHVLQDRIIQENGCTHSFNTMFCCVKCFHACKIFFFFPQQCIFELIVAFSTFSLWILWSLCLEKACNQGLLSAAHLFPNLTLMEFLLNFRSCNTDPLFTDLFFTDILSSVCILAHCTVVFHPTSEFGARVG